MFYIVPTKRGLGIELWGTCDDLDNLHEIISKFWMDEEYEFKRGFESRAKVISGVSYAIRKAKEGFRSKREHGHFTLEDQVYYGTQLSWVHILFALAALRYNMRFYEINKLERAVFFQLEYWLENAMRSYDAKGSDKLIPLIEDGIYGANDYMYQYMLSMNLDYFLLNGGKRAFRQLPNLMKKADFFSHEYQEYKTFLEKEAKRLNCDITEMEINDENIDYGSIKW